MDIFEECLDTLSNKNITKKNIMQKLQQLALLIDEMIDEGIVINTNAEELESKMNMRESKVTVSEQKSTSIFGNVLYFYL